MKIGDYAEKAEVFTKYRQYSQYLKLQWKHFSKLKNTNYGMKLWKQSKCMPPIYLMNTLKLRLILRTSASNLKDVSPDIR